MDSFSFLGSVHGAFVEELYQEYLENPDAVEPSWRSFFQGYSFAHQNYSDEELEQIEIPEGVNKEFKVINLINEYRTRGHLFTKTNPVRQRRLYKPDLAIERFGLSNDDLDIVFQAGTELRIGAATLKSIITHLNAIYCDHIGVEFMHIREPEELNWIMDQFHVNDNRPAYSKEEKTRILQKLNDAVGFENFLHTKFVGQKRFSLEGGESLIPALDKLVEKGADLGVEEIVVGMAHRGRLNVLTNIFGKESRMIFSEFEGKEYVEDDFDGDVKYHLGYTREKTTASGKEVKMSLIPNPSHLETVAAVVQGISRSKIDQIYKSNKKVVPVLIHGDAAVAGQGIVYEIIQMAQLKGYETGGSIHIVINNQVGFTTNYLDARSSTYCTDVAKTTLCPVLHVNGDDPEAVVHAIEFSIKYRQQFHKDVFIDLLCYRKYGHNEGDEPRFTQPKLYKEIAKHPNPKDLYSQQLIAEGLVSAEEIKKLDADLKEYLQRELDASKEFKTNSITNFLEDEWDEVGVAGDDDFIASPETGVSVEDLKRIAKILYTVPQGHSIYRKAKKILGDRQKMIEETDALDWGMAELLAYGSLIDEGHPVRLTGQDVERGTFSHRHSVLKTENSETEICLLNEIKPNEVPFDIYNSLLSEYGVLGFEYGYAMATPETLTLWEAQFGDFSNGAQIVIDQYLSAAEDKWKVQNGLVMLLPHGYEGQGAEHSSARMERYLQLCAQDNMQMVNCTTPANIFHVLRRQLNRDFRKPLVVFSPKKLLRYPSCVSTIGELANGKFEEVYDDTKADPSKVEKVVFCSGKLFYDLDEEREKNPNDKVAIVRIEQLYPLPINQMDALVAKYSNATQYVWAQEEPENMGAWSHMLRHYRKVNLDVVARSASAAPASGSSLRAAKRQRAVIEGVFA